MRGFTSKNIGVINGVKNSTLQPFFKQAVVVGNLNAGTYPEISGMTRPTKPENIGRNYMWAHQDSGQSSKLFVMNLENASVAGEWTLGSLSLTQNAPTDFEDCTSVRVGNTSYILIGDMGNNTGSTAGLRTATVTGADIIVYRIKEPTITGSNGTILDADIETIGCAFPGVNGPPNVAGGRDVETMFADPDSGDIYFITKRNFPALIYKLPFSSSYTGLQTLEYIGQLANFTSVSSNSISGGSKTFAVSGLSFPVGMRIRAQNSTTNYMEGFVTAMSNGSVTMYVEVNTPTMSEVQFGGSGTYTSWNITLPTSFTPTGNNGCATGGTCDPSGTSIIICSYLTNYLFTKKKTESFGAALSRAPLLMAAVPGNAYLRHDNTPPAMPQREALEFGDPLGKYLYTASEWNSARGASNPLFKYDRLERPLVSVRLQNGLDGYTGCSDTYINAASPTINYGPSGSLVCDVDVTNVTFSAAATASGGSHTTFTTTTFGASAGINRKATVTGSSYTGYNGTWKVSNFVGTTGITLKVPYVSTAAGNMSVHSNDREGLIKYNLSSIPSGATIVDSTLRIFVNTEGLTCALHKMNRNWTDSDTFNSLSGVMVTQDGSDAAFAPDYLGSGMATYVLFCDMPIPPATIQNWVNGTSPNYGWVVQEWRDDLGGNGFQFDSSESSTQSRKPMLSLSYYV